jgi:hypothetical protein
MRFEMLFDAAYAPEIGQRAIEFGKRSYQSVLKRGGKRRQFDASPQLPQCDHQHLHVRPHADGQSRLFRFGQLEAAALHGHHRTGVLGAAQRVLDHAAPRRRGGAHLPGTLSRRNAP